MPMLVFKSMLMLLMTHAHILVHDLGQYSFSKTNVYAQVQAKNQGSLSKNFQMLIEQGFGVGKTLRVSCCGFGAAARERKTSKSHQLFYSLSR